MKSRTLILNTLQIQQKLQRIACQIVEDNYAEKSIFVAGVAKSGFIMAKNLVQILRKNYKLEVTLLEVVIDKENPLQPALIGIKSKATLTKKVVILVDDVLNSGRTLIHCLKPFLESDVKKIRTVLLVDRDHKRYPVAADFVGITLSTTSKELIVADIKKEKIDAVYLE
jgi:pyrimidine operon attenuation protein/uracil phosphoribosyltransferase